MVEQLLKAFLVGGSVALLVSILMAWCVGGFHSTSHFTDAQEDGKAYYGQNCASCHEENQLQLKKVPQICSFSSIANYRAEVRRRMLKYLKSF